LGRTFTPEDDRTPGAHPVAVLSHASWQKRFGGDRNIVGQTALLNHQSYTIIGVAPPRFNGTEIIFAPELWAPMMMLEQIERGAKQLEQRNISQSYCVGRLKPGVSMAQAESSLSNLMAQLGREYPDSNEGKGMMLTPPGLIHPTLRTPFIGFAGVLMLTVALVLLIACTNLAGLLLARATQRRVVRSLQHVHVMSPGFNPDHVVTLTMSLGNQGYDATRGKQFQQQVIDWVSHLPGVKSAATTDILPLSLGSSDSSVFIEEAPPTRGAQTPYALNARVSPGYFQTMEIPLIAGRDFTERDREDRPRIVVINETFARRFWPGQYALGKRFRYSRADGPLVEVAGVVKDGKYLSLGEDPKPFFYLPALQSYDETTTLVARTTNDPSATLATIRGEVLKLDSTMPFAEVKTLTEHMSLSLFPLRIGASIVGSFGLLALLLAAIGIYGVMAFAVSQRTREIGIRMALGAQRRDVLRLIIIQGVTLMLIGLGFGLAGALLLTRLMSSVLYGVSATDVVTFASVTALLGLVVLLACWIPARRATKFDPMTALRCD